MPTWGEILTELQDPSNLLPNGAQDFDRVRRKYLGQLFALTGRPTIVYYTDWFGKGGPASSITLEDMQGMMEVCKDLPGPNLDVLLHSPGGSPEATASIIRYLRTKFFHIRAFVPLAAMSAATMWALAGDVIVMGKHSQLGPIDPQMVAGAWTAPARAILRQFAQAKEECKDPSLLGAWIPILQQYGPALIQQCEAAEALAQRLVREWFEKYMFAGGPDAATKAEHVAGYFANYEIHQSHSLGIDREQARSQGVRIDDLESDQALQDAVLSVHHATMHTLQGPAVKIVENHLGRTYAKITQQLVMQVPMMGLPSPLGPLPPGTASSPPVLVAPPATPAGQS
ncbi:MAG: SDH family Clp fold serine proteinase [Acidimicrobiia bacterium]